MYRTLLGAHIVAGNVALFAAVGAMLSRKGGPIHLWSGRAFSIGMGVIFLTALPMSLMRPNVFLLLVALFNGYLAWSGWIRARNRGGEPITAEWLGASAMAGTAVVMLAGGVFMLVSGNLMGIVLVVFAGIGGGLAVADLRGMRSRRYRGAGRIASHLTRMLGATIGAFTAFLVVNVRVEPAFVVWIAPSLLLTPVVVYWGRRVRGPAAAGPGSERKTLAQSA
jgi:hypothetical protein